MGFKRMIDLARHVDADALYTDLKEHGCQVPADASRHLNQVLNTLYFRWGQKDSTGKKKTSLPPAEKMSKELRSILRTSRPVYTSSDLRFLVSGDALLMTKSSWWPRATMSRVIIGATQEMVTTSMVLVKMLGYQVSSAGVLDMIPRKVKDRQGKRVHISLSKGEVRLSTAEQAEGSRTSVPMGTFSDHVRFLNDTEETWYMAIVPRKGKPGLYIHDGTAALHFNP
jgi:hypothetical protein